MAVFSFPAGAQDLTNHVFGYFGYNHQVHAVLELPKLKNEMQPL